MIEYPVALPHQRRYLSMSKKFFGMMTRRERWGLSARGCLVLCLILLVSLVSIILAIHPFLALTKRADSNILVVEGWVHEYAINAAVREFQANHYERVYTTGGPVEGMGGFSNIYNTSASVGAGRLRDAGIAPDLVQMVPSRVNERDRTYSSAIALHNWFRENHLAVPQLNVLTQDAHARRTRLLFQKAFGKETKIGVISVPSPDYNAKYWWRYSEGVKEIMSEGGAYIYARFFFHPDW